MPIEIKEVVIRAVVTGTGTGQAQGPAGGGGGNDQASGSPDTVVSEAVRQVLEILKQKEER